MTRVISKEFEFDAGHRIMGHLGVCNNYHGHRYKCILHIHYSDVGELGYAIDFSEIKHKFGRFLDQYFDHAMILNPKDDLIKYLRDKGMRCWVMHTVNGNPTAENMAEELLVIAKMIFPHRSIYAVSLYETPSSNVIVTNDEFGVGIEDWEDLMQILNQFFIENGIQQD